MTIGILLFASAGDRLKGDPGFPGTFEFPVEYGVVEGSYRDLVDGTKEACERLCKAAKTLEAKGVQAIAGDCGLMSLYQKEIATAVHIPVLSSSLLLVPLLRTLISDKDTIGILTGHSALLGKHHLEGAGIEDLEGITIQGMQNEPHFQKVVITGTDVQQYNLMKQDVFSGVEKLIHTCRGGGALGAVLLECSNLAVFGGEITRQYRIPVFDINTGIYLLKEGFIKKLYNN